MKIGTWVVIGVVVLGSGWFFSSRLVSPSPQSPAPSNANVAIVDGKQIVTINVKGGYQPQMSIVKAGMPTYLRFVTNGTFDCSSTIRIPGLGISQSLPSTGTTDVAVGNLQAGTLQGTCGMGMYRFNVEAKS